MKVFALSCLALVVVVLSGFPGSVLGERPPAATIDRERNNQNDLQQRQAIRTALIGEPSLSARAKRCQIIVRGGFATLCGNVESENDRNTVQILTALVVGRHHVANALVVKTGRSK